MKHVAFFGDGEKTFALPSDQIDQLESKLGTGVGAIYARVMTANFKLADLIEVIRLGLIGGGMSPKDAFTLVESYAKPTPIIEIFQLAADILEVRWTGRLEAPAPATQDELRQAATTGDLAAAISAAYADVPA